MKRKTDFLYCVASSSWFLSHFGAGGAENTSLFWCSHGRKVEVDIFRCRSAGYRSTRT